MTPGDPGDPRCARCGRAEWQRGRQHVVVAPVTGEALAYDHLQPGRGDWTCVGCGLSITDTLEASRLFEAVVRRQTDARLVTGVRPGR
jgi:hypothetical protein